MAIWKYFSVKMQVFPLNKQILVMLSCMKSNMQLKPNSLNEIFYPTGNELVVEVKCKCRSNSFVLFPLNTAEIVTFL